MNGSEVYISSEEDYNIVVDLKEYKEEFESLRPFIALIARNICELDNTAQKFDRLHSGVWAVEDTCPKRGDPLPGHVRLGGGTHGLHL